MISLTQPLSNTIRTFIIIFSLIIINNSVPSTDNYCFSISSSTVSLKKSFTVYKSFLNLLACAKNEIQDYKITAESFIKQTEEVAKTWKIVKVEAKKSNYSTNILWPVKGVITSKFGMRVHPVTGDRSFHNGIDIRGKAGTNVICPVEGIVIASGWSGALGRMVKLKTLSGHTLCFGHLSKINCKIGQKLNKGQLLGKVGCSGRATGPHLHFTVYYRGNYINPIKYLSK